MLWNDLSQNINLSVSYLSPQGYYSLINKTLIILISVQNDGTYIINNAYPVSYIFHREKCVVPKGAE